MFNQGRRQRRQRRETQGAFDGRGGDGLARRDVQPNKRGARRAREKLDRAVAEREDASLAQVAEELRAGDRFLLTTHEGPDGDALGSLLALHHMLIQLGKDSVMFLDAKEFPLPVEYRFLPLEELISYHL